MENLLNGYHLSSLTELGPVHDAECSFANHLDILV